MVVTKNDGKLSFPPPTSGSLAWFRVLLETLLIDCTKDRAQLIKCFAIQPSQRPQQAVIFQSTMNGEHSLLLYQEVELIYLIEQQVY